MISFFLIVSGLAGLWLGTKWMISGAMGIAERWGLSHAFVGLAVLAVGTDLPELFVSVDAALLQLKGIESSGIVTGNAIGSSFSQITFILGISGLFVPFFMPLRSLVMNGVFLLLSIFLLFYFGYDGLVSRWEGAVMLFCYLVYYVMLLRSKNNGNETGNYEGVHKKLTQIVFFLLGGLFILIFSSHLVVNHAMLLTNEWGMSQSLVGVAIIGLGTSLPELAVSIGAAFRGSGELSMGNIIGSNIFDGFIPVGIGALISTTKVEEEILYYDLPFLLFATILVLIFLTRQRGISKTEGSLMVLIYLTYLVMKML